MLDALTGDANKAVRGAVVLNAAAALYVGGRAKSFDDGVEIAEQAVQSGAGLAALEKLRAAFAPKS